jgi:formimidoylglutamate deiminase
VSRQIVEADLTWTGDTFEPGVRIAVDGDGRIADVGALQDAPTRRLEGQALLPGFVSAHSHAFQRGLRGRGERFPDGTGSFWTWREAMYDLVLSLDQSRFVELCTRAFQEMRDAGVTTVGEFHYFHHTTGTDDWAFDEAVLEAARAAGIRIALLETFYQTGGIGRPLGQAQRRFRTRSLDGFWKQMDHLAATIDRRRESLGAAVHSLRAAGIEEIATIQEETRHRKLVLHIHVEEQRKEADETRTAYGKRPMAVLNALFPSADGVTAVHCTHTEPDDLRRFLAAGGRVCVCPLTEANLGDGIPDLTATLGYEGRLSLGTDSNARISLLEEMRWLEYGQRLRHEVRGAVVDAEGHAARRLFDAATAGGAQALGLACGAIEPGRWADFLTVDLTHPLFAEVESDHLLDAIVFGAGNEVITATCVGGEWRNVRRET